MAQWLEEQVHNQGLDTYFTNVWQLVCSSKNKQSKTNSLVSLMFDNCAQIQFLNV